MKKSILWFILLLLAVSANAQDRVITSGNDTIFCRIIDVSSGFIRYEQYSRTDGRIVKIIQMKNIVEYRQANDAAVENPWLTGFSAGIGFMPRITDNAINTDQIEGYEKVKWGLNLTGSLYYLFTPKIGWGGTYSFFTSGINGNFLSQLENSYPIYSYIYLRERHILNFAGMSFLLQQLPVYNQKIRFRESLSVGPLFYRGESQFSQRFPVATGVSYVAQQALIEGYTVGLSAECAVEYPIVPGLDAGVVIGYLYGKVTKVNGKSVDSNGSLYEARGAQLDNPLNVSRLSLSMIVRFTR